MSVTIYHNPRCSKSRQTLALLEDRGVAPQVVHYLETPPDAADRAAMSAQARPFAARSLVLCLVIVAPTTADQWLFYYSAAGAPKARFAGSGSWSTLNGSPPIVIVSPSTVTLPG